MRGQQLQNTSTIEVNDIFETMWQHNFSNKQQIEVHHTHHPKHQPQNGTLSIPTQSIRQNPIHRNRHTTTNPRKHSQQTNCKVSKHRTINTPSTRHLPKVPTVLKVPKPLKLLFPKNCQISKMAIWQFQIKVQKNPLFLCQFKKHPYLCTLNFVWARFTCRLKSVFGYRISKAKKLWP